MHTIWIAIIINSIPIATCNWKVYISSLTETVLQKSVDQTHSIVLSSGAGYKWSQLILRFCSGQKVHGLEKTWSIRGGLSRAPCGQATILGGQWADKIKASKCLEDTKIRNGLYSPDGFVETGIIYQPGKHPAWSMNFIISAHYLLHVNITFLHVDLSYSWPNCWVEGLTMLPSLKTTPPRSFGYNYVVKQIVICGKRPPFTVPYAWWNSPNFGLIPYPSYNDHIRYRSSFQSCSIAHFIYQVHEDGSRESLIQMAVYKAEEYRQVEEHVLLLVNTVNKLPSEVHYHLYTHFMYRINFSLVEDQDQLYLGCANFTAYDGPTYRSKLLHLSPNLPFPCQRYYERDRGAKCVASTGLSSAFQVCYISYRDILLGCVVLL